MRNFYIFICIFFLYSIAASFASVESIQQREKECLKGLFSNTSMAECAIQAYSQAEKEINALLPKIQNINNNQYLWKLYKTSTENSVNTILENSLGTMYYLFAKNNTLNINLNRLFVLNNINKNIPYKQEPYMSDRLKNCLSKSTSGIEKEKCYIKETQQFSNEIDNTLKELQTLYSQTEYNKIKNNQTAWLNYKNDTERILNNKVSRLVKTQIIYSLYAERRSQLFSIIPLTAALPADRYTLSYHP